MDDFDSEESLKRIEAVASLIERVKSSSDADVTADVDRFLGLRASQCDTTQQRLAAADEQKGKEKSRTVINKSNDSPLDLPPNLPAEQRGRGMPLQFAN